MRTLILTLFFTAGAANAQKLLEPVTPNVLLRGWSGSVSTSAGLNSIGGEAPDRESAKAPARSNTIATSIRYNPVSFWYAGATFVRYVQPARRQPWNPDFTYGFGYNDWHPGTWSVTYDNYGANCLRCKGGSPMTRFQEGSFSLGYKAPITRGPFALSAGAHVSPRYFDLASNNKRAAKGTATADIRWTVYGRWYVSGHAVYYPIRGQQQPWDPDFTYGFGYFDWRPGKISIEYSNYAANRFAKSTQAGRRGTFQDGSVSVSWTWKQRGKG